MKKVFIKLTVESEKLKVVLKQSVVLPTSLPSLRENWGFKLVILHKALQIFAAIHYFSIWLTFETYVNLPTSWLDCFVLHYTYWLVGYTTHLKVEWKTLAMTERETTSLIYSFALTQQTNSNKCKQYQCDIIVQECWNTRIKNMIMLSICIQSGSWT